MASELAPANFNNLLKDTHNTGLANIDFAAHARSMGANSIQVETIGELKDAIAKASNNEGVNVIAIDTDPVHSTPGNCWWEVEIPEVSERKEVVEKHKEQVASRKQQRGY